MFPPSPYHFVLDKLTPPIFFRIGQGESYLNVTLTLVDRNIQALCWGFNLP